MENVKLACAYLGCWREETAIRADFGARRDRELSRDPSSSFAFFRWTETSYSLFSGRLPMIVVCSSGSPPVPFLLWFSFPLLII
jgi:hypothetical protein